jgi:hypothetical protein
LKHSIFIVIGTALSLCLVSACSSTSNNSDGALEPQLNTAYLLIDDGKDSQAIALLTSLQQEGFTQPEVSVALASAYLHRAGINALDLYQSVRGMNFDLSGRETLLKTKYASEIQIVKAHLQAQNREPAVDQVVEAAAVASLTIDDLQMLPTLDATHQADLQEAYDVLAGAQILSQGDHLFRAMVAVILFKQILFEPLPATFDQSSICNLPLAAITTFLTDQVDLLTLLVVDVQVAFPTTAPSLSGPGQVLTTLQTQLNSGYLGQILSQLQNDQSTSWLCGH